MEPHTNTLSDDLTHSLIQVLTPAGSSVGTAFVLAHGLAVTCAHVVVSAEAQLGGFLRIRFATDGSEHDACVMRDGWSPPDADDVAFLQISTMPPAVRAVVLGTAKNRTGHAYHAPGYAPLGPSDMRHAHDDIGGLAKLDSGPRTLLQIKGPLVEKGQSGAPIFDLHKERVVAMLTSYKDRGGERIAYAIPADTLVAAHPDLKLWPDAYGPNERDAYLEYLCKDFGEITLLGGKKVPLEQLYISLRADQMDVVERQAERLRLEDLTQALTAPGEITDPYAAHNAVRRAVVRAPASKMLTARHWDTLFGMREKATYSLAEVVQRHPHVVILGDPGSGKTTLGKWLVLQHARALLAGESRVRVRADLARPGTDAETLVDLGPTRLPVFVRIAEYVKQNWKAASNNFNRSLADYLGEHVDAARLPRGLSPEAVRTLTQDALTQGTALVILDGLDEVGNIDQRRAVMQEIKTFKEAHRPALARTQLERRELYNLLVLTSRIVGYQFHPLTDLPHYTVEEMDAAAIGAFCQAWMTHIARVNDAHEQAIRLQTAILQHAHPGVRTLAGNPLLLTILAQVYLDNPAHALPAQRVALFDATVKAFYAQRRAIWEAAGIPPEHLTSRLILPLGAVATYLHSEETGGFTDEETLCDQLAEAGLNLLQVETTLSEARDVTGFLIERGEGVYAFIHRALQEYFAAHWLVRDVARDLQHVTSELVSHALDPTWREPLALAVGILARKHSKKLPTILSALLNTQDRAGDFIPRREFLIATTCAECECLPPNAEPIIGHTAERLLTIYAKHEGYGRSTVIHNRIQRAFSILRDSVGNKSTEEVLCTALRANDFERRYAAADLILELEWHTPITARALLAAWRAYPDPAATLLAALRQHFEQRPEDFLDIDLPMRQALYDNPQLWEHLQNDTCGQVLFRMLYMEEGSSFYIENIFRDSPLNDILLIMLKQKPNESDWHTWAKRELLPLVGTLGTATARDAVLALSALGDGHWITPSIVVTNTAPQKLLPIIASFAFILAITRNQVLARDYNIALDLVHALARTLNYIRACRSKLRSAFNRDVGFANKRDIGFANNHDIELASKRAKKLARERLAREQLARERLVSNLKDAFERNITLVNDLELDLYHIRDLAQDLVRDLDRDVKRDFAHDLTIARERDRDLTLDRDRVLAHALDLDRDRDRRLYHVQNLENDLLAIESLLKSKKMRSAAIASEADLQKAIDIVSHSHRQTSLIKPLLSIPAFRVYEILLETLVLYTHSTLSPQVRSPLSSIDLNTQNLSDLLNALSNPDDTQREQARKVLLKDRPASELGREVIEQLARTASRHRNEPQIGLQCEWALHCIRHDTPSWIKSWIAQVAAQSDDVDIAEFILGNIYDITDKGLAAVLGALPHSGARVNIVLLHSLSWLARLDKIPKDQRASTRTHLLKWLAGAPSSKICAALFNVLGHWQSDEGNMAEHLYTLMETLPHMDKRIGCYHALARLAARDATIEERIHNALCALLPLPQAASALVRLVTQRMNTERAQEILGRLKADLLNPTLILQASLDAGADDDPWKDNYHNLLAQVVHAHIAEARTEAESEELLSALITRFAQCMTNEVEGWPARDITLAALTACIERMPTAIQQAAHKQDVALEDLLIRAATDVDSHDGRRHALTALSYLHVVSPSIAEALLAGCQDERTVQEDALIAAGRFQRISGDPLPTLAPALTGPSIHTAYAVARMFGALGANAAGADLRERMVDALVNALNDEGCQREGPDGALADTFYKALLQVVGWPA